MQKVPLEVPEHLKEIVPNSNRFIHEKLRNHQKFNEQQQWILERKTAGRPGRCSGCMEKDMIRVGDVHFAVKGLFYDEPKDKIHNTTLRFCLNEGCVKNISSSRHNIRPMPSGTIVRRSPQLGTVDINTKASALLVAAIDGWVCINPVAVV